MLDVICFKCHVVSSKSIFNMRNFTLHIPNCPEIDLKQQQKNHPRLPKKPKAMLKMTDFFHFFQWRVNKFF